VSAVADLALADRLRAVGEQRYHDKHPFHRKLVAGELDARSTSSWVANRYYYQKAIPHQGRLRSGVAPVGANTGANGSRAYFDHDGTDGGVGGTEKWLALCARSASDDADVLSETAALRPGTRFAVDAYVDFARRKPWLEAVASSLTELFGPPVMAARVEAIVAKYPWIDPRADSDTFPTASFAPRDATLALGWVLEEARTPEQQDACVAALRFKCDVCGASSTRPRSTAACSREHAL
jgi:pyrroloquinoline-quinone synthase